MTAMTDTDQQPTVRNTQNVESRLARIKALVEAIESVALREVDFPGDMGEAAGWLRQMAVEELEKVKAVLDLDVMGRDC